MADNRPMNRPISPNNLFTVPLVGDPQASPDGARVAHLLAIARGCYAATISQTPSWSI